MPRNYQLKRNNPYRMDHNLYMQITYMIKRYRDLILQYNGVLHGSTPPADGMPRGNETGDPTAKKAALMIELSCQITAIDDTIAELRGKYCRTCTGEIFDPYEAFLDYGVFCYYRSKPDKDEAPSYKTWKRYRAEFVYKVAKNLNYF